MEADRDGLRSSTCKVNRGLYALRYASCPGDAPPLASVSVVDGSLDLIASPGREPGVLEGPGQALIILARTQGMFEIRVSQPSRGRGTEASFSLDLLDEGNDRPPEGRRGHDADATRPESGAARRTSLPLDVVAHVSRRGDINVADGEWVAGPSDILPIEGLAIATARRDATIAIRVQTVQTQGRWSRWHGEGEFAGSRQRADALTGIELALNGDAPPDFLIACEVMHLGTPSRKAEGRELSFLGSDPLVGFRLELIGVIKDPSDERFDMRLPPQGRAKVFRARK